MLSSDSNDNNEQETMAARQAAMDKLVPGLAASEYGKMPASFYSNSQRVAPTTIESDVIEQVESERNPTYATECRTKPIRQPILPRDQFDGVSSDEESDEERTLESDESEEDQPQVVGDIEFDMAEEQDEFLEFSRQALGITNEQWGEIIRDRKDRGGMSQLKLNWPILTRLPVFVPSGAAAEPLSSSQNLGAAKKTTTSTKVSYSGHTSTSGARPEVNPDLDSFEAVMQKMDAELARSRPKKANSASRQVQVSDKGKDKANVTADDEGDIEAAMDAELAATLQRGDNDDDHEGEESLDYNLIKNFLESFKSQGGLSGPVSNLAGRLQQGWQLPRDSDEYSKSHGT
jgi:hypothetical protein